MMQFNFADWHHWRNVLTASMWCRQQVPLKCWYISTNLHGITSQRTIIF